MAHRVKEITTLRIHLTLSRPISGSMQTDIFRLRHAIISALQSTQESAKSQSIVDTFVPAGEQFSECSAKAVNQIEDALLAGKPVRAAVLEADLGL